MLGEARSVDFKKTDSVLEAVLLEADLIKKFQPPYNTKDKDDKSFNCAVITDEDFPSVLIVRQKDIDAPLLKVNGQKSKVHSRKLLAVYGPFPNGFQLRITLKIIRRIFPFHDSCMPFTTQKQHTNKSENVGVSHACFNRQIGLCPGICTGEISKEEYAKTIQHIRLFFEGKKARLLKVLEREMKQAARAQEFEHAGKLKRQLFALKHIQDVALLRREATPPLIPPLKRGEGRGGVFRVEGYDLSHFGGKDIVGALAVVEDGVARQSEYRLFKIRDITIQNEVAGLQEIIRWRVTHPEWAFPQLIVVDGNEVQKCAAEATLAEATRSIPVVAVVKDERHRPREIIGMSALSVGQHTNSLQNVGMFANQGELRAAILLANSEAHRFALRFQKRRRAF
jgi:excinuclease ABC subunit C